MSLCDDSAACRCTSFGLWLLGACLAGSLVCCSDKREPQSAPSTACIACSSPDASVFDGAASAADFWASLPTCLRAVTTSEGPNPYLYSVSWSPTADFVLAGTTDEVRMIQVDVPGGTLTQVANYTAQTGNLVLEWDQTGALALSAGQDLRLLAATVDPPSITELASYAGQTGQIYAVSWSPDFSHVLTASEDGTVRLLRVSSAPAALEEQAIFTGHVGKVFDVAWAPDGKHALSVGLDKSLRLLAVDTDQASISQLSLVRDTDWESAVSWGSAATPILSGTWGYRNALQVWSVPTDFSALVEQSELVGQTPGVQVIEWSRDRSRLIVAEHEDTLHLFSRNAMNITPLGTLGAHYTGVHSVAWSRDGNSLVVASSHGDIATLVDVSGCD
jgi:WD40 repeat protein